MADKTYTTTDIKALWSDYGTRTVYRVMRAGKWVIEDVLPRQIDAVRVERVKARDAMTFPEFLERYDA